MAELSAADKRVLNYKEPVVTAASLAEERWRKQRNLLIGVVALAAVISLAVLFGSQGIISR
jgi:hypothetical protein